MYIMYIAASYKKRLDIESYQLIESIEPYHI